MEHVRATEYAKTWPRELPIAGDTWTMCIVAPAPQTFRGHASPRLCPSPRRYDAGEAITARTVQPTQILATKLFIPPLPPKAVLRPRLVERLDEGLQRKLTPSLPRPASVDHAAERPGRWLP